MLMFAPRWTVARTVGLTLGAALAISAIPTALALASDHVSPPSPAQRQKTAGPAKAAPTAECLAAQNALKPLREQDRTEDKAERAADKHDAASRAADRSEDQREKAQLRTAQDAVRSACRTQRTAECLAAQNALKALHEQDRTEDRAERATDKHDAASRAADRSEDQAEKAQRKPGLNLCLDAGWAVGKL